MSTVVCPHCGQTSSEVAPGHRCPFCQRSSAQSEITKRLLPTLQVEKAGVENVARCAVMPSPTKEWVQADNSKALSAAKIQWDLDGLLAPSEIAGDIGRLGSYRILSVLGGGGMGIVFRALDPVLGREVAIKAMLPYVAKNPDSRRRFLCEARAMAARKHEHIITIYHVGEEDSLPYMVMELLEGESLEVCLRRAGILPIDEIERIGIEIADGLAAAHERGLVHRDIKPANIWLEGERGCVKILDFGLARVVDDDIHLTKPGTILGTPAYMSPEQARGGAVDHRTDLFSLGCILYQLCTGRTPFGGASSYEVLSSLAMETPRSIYEANTDVPPALVNLISSMLAKNPDDRPSSARGIVESLAAIRREMGRSDILGLGDKEPTLADEGPLSKGNNEESAVAPSDVVPKTPPPLPDELDQLPGCTLGHFAIRSVLGEGKHGMVFRARDLDAGRVVALKVLSPEFPRNDREIQNFSKAMSAALAIRHPNIVTILGAGKTDRFCWIAMEFVEGNNLEKAIHEWKLAGESSWLRAFRVAVDIGQALLAMRQRHLIHGNLTLRNILVRRADQTAQLNDLKLLKALNNSVLYQQGLDDKLADEMYFLSPEQIDSTSSFIDHLCDLYGLGVVVYYVLTGHPPFRGESMEETFALIRESQPESPRKRDKSIPKEFDHIVMRMLAKYQEDRYQGPEELLADLRIIGRKHDMPL